MDIENTTLNISDDSIEKKNPESWIGVYRILALVAAGFVGYGAIKYTTDSQFSTSVDEMAHKVWASYITLMTDFESPGMR